MNISFSLRVEMESRRCCVCGTFWAMEGNGGRCPNCADDNLRKADARVKHAERVARSCKAAMRAAKRRKSR